MKNPILILALGLTIFSCKKDETTTPTPTPTTPADTSMVNLPEEFAAQEGYLMEMA
ncbi:MAG: putative hemolysin [Patiriisocius sp.]|jgi:putative hemolysin